MYIAPHFSDFIFIRIGTAVDDLDMIKEKALFPGL
jgi:hypothetical protein